MRPNLSSPLARTSFEVNKMAAAAACAKAQPCVLNDLSNKIETKTLTFMSFSVRVQYFRVRCLIKRQQSRLSIFYPSNNEVLWSLSILK